MKKIGVLLIISLLFTLPLIFQIATAQEDLIDKAAETDPSDIIEGAQEKAETKWDYLRREWREILLNKPVIGPIIRFAEKILNPISMALLKRPIEFTWVYFFTLAMWITIIVIVFRLVLNGFGTNAIISLLIALIVSTLAIRTIPKTFFEFQLKLIWKIIIIIILIAIISFFSVFSEAMKKGLKKGKEERRERKAAAAEKIHDLKLKELRERTKK